MSKSFVTLAGFVVTCCENAINMIARGETLSATKTHIAERCENQRDGLKYAELAGIFHTAMACGRKAGFVALLQLVQQEYATLARIEWQNRRASRVVQRCADVGITVTIQDVLQTATARATEHYSVSAAVGELVGEFGDG